MRNKLAKHVADISRCPRQVRDPHVEPRNGGLSPENPSQVGTRVVNIFNMVNIVIRIIIFIMVGCPLKTLHRWGQEVLSLSYGHHFHQNHCCHGRLASQNPSYNTFTIKKVPIQQCLNILLLLITRVCTAAQPKTGSLAPLQKPREESLLAWLHVIHPGLFTSR